VENKLIEVVFCGHQERIDGTSFLLVTEVKNLSTVKYDPEKHVLIEIRKKRGENMPRYRERKNGYRSIWSKRFKRHMRHRLVWHLWHEVAYEDAVKLVKAMQWG